MEYNVEVFISTAYATRITADSQEEAEQKAKAEAIKFYNLDERRTNFEIGINEQGR